MLLLCIFQNGTTPALPQSYQVLSHLTTLAINVQKHAYIYIHSLATSLVISCWYWFEPLLSTKEENPPYHYTTTNKPNHWYKGHWYILIHFMLFMPNCDPTYPNVAAELEIMFFLFSIVHFLGDPMHTVASVSCS